MNLLIKLFGVHVEDAARVAHVSLAFRGGINAGWIVLAIIILGVIVFWGYRRSAQHVTPVRRYIMTALRTLFLLLILLLLMRPVLAFVIEGSIRRTLLVLCDATTSMKLQDPRTDQDDLKRAAMAENMLDATKGLKQNLSAADASRVANVPRIDVLKAVLRNPKIDLLPRLAKEYDLRPFSFGTALTDLTPATTQPAPSATAGKPAPVTSASFAWVDRIVPNSPMTAIGDATRDVLGRTRGQPIAGIVLVTDGGNNAGSDPMVAARMAREDGVPLYIYGVGISEPKDIIVANVFAPDVSFVRDEVPVTVRVRTQNLKGLHGQLVLKLGDEKVDEKDVLFDDTEQAIAMKFTPKKAGEFALTASIEARPDEASKDNNSYTRHLRVVDGKIKVLLVEQSPRWEFKYLMQQLLRDRRVDLKCVLLDADRGIVNAPGSPYLPHFPTTKEELYKFDLIILGDVDPKSLTTDQLDGITESVAKFGGGFLMIAGKNHAPADYLENEIGKMLPVEFDAKAPLAGMSSRANLDDKPIKLELTAAGQRAPMLRLSDNEQESLDRWKNLPPIYWAYRVARPKPGAEVLLVDPDPLKSSRFGKMPVVAVQQYGLGQVMWLGTDNTWRWRKNKGDQYYIALWGQMIQRLSLPHLLGAAKRTQLTSDKLQYGQGEDVTVYARLYTQSYEPVTDPTIRGFYADTTAPDAISQADHEVQLRALPDQPGMYRAVFKAITPGAYKFHVGTPGDPAVKLDFSVIEPKMELGDTAMNESLLRQLADTSGGKFYREEDVYQMPDAIRLKAERVRSTLEVEIWSSPFYFLLLLGVVTAEWILRKMSQLK